jgi:uncharacterized membrane protein
MDFEHAIDSVGRAIDAIGVAVIAGGLVYVTVAHAIRRHGLADPFRHYRRKVGRVILLGLEFLVAADIIRTVAVTPTFQSVGVLAIIVLIRTFLSFTLEVELEGRWPWQRRPDAAA